MDAMSYLNVIWFNHEESDTNNLRNKFLMYAFGDWMFIHVCSKHLSEQRDDIEPLHNFLISVIIDT